MVEAITRTTQVNKPRIVVCSAEGMQAGDLAALLIRDFEVERVMTLPGLILAMEQSVQALIIFMDNSPFCLPGIPKVFNQLSLWNTRVLIFGSGRNQQFSWGSNNVRRFAQIPTCQTILEALDGLTPVENEAH